MLLPACLLLPATACLSTTGEAATAACLPSCMPANAFLPATGKATNTGANACLLLPACYCLPDTGEPTSNFAQHASGAALAARSSATQQGLAVAGANSSLSLQTINSGNDFRHLTTHHEQVSKQGGGLGQWSVPGVGWVCKVCGGVGLGVCCVV